MTHFLIWFSALSFLGYGFSCVFSAHMAAEFERYRLAGFRALTGILQILGAVGLLFGLIAPTIGLIAAAGLTMQMFLGFCVRMKIRDSFIQSAPSFIFMWVNAYLTHQFLQILS